MSVQNADDAGAQTVKFCFDERHHGTGDLNIEMYHPALLSLCKAAVGACGVEGTCMRAGQAVMATAAQSLWQLPAWRPSPGQRSAELWTVV